MHLFSSRKTRQQPSVDDVRPQLPRRRRKAHDNPMYANHGIKPFQSELNLLPMSPPPPYDAYENEYVQQQTQMQPTAFYQQPYQSQHYLPVPQSMQNNRSRKKPSAWISTVDLTRQPNASPYRQEQGWQSSANLVPASRFNECPIVRSLNQSAALCDRVAASINEALARIDGEEEEHDDLAKITRDLSLEETRAAEQTWTGSIIDFGKTWLYANSRLPPYLPAMKIYMATWQIICVAAQTSMDVYRRPHKGEREDYVDADFRRGTKAMVVKSRPVDDKNLIVLAIRGSKWNVIDWAVNFRPAPSEPIGFLDDGGNACHAGFLQVARAMVVPVAARLRHLLEQDPSRASSSLLITGHSAGGAVASLLYMHMMATSFESELNLLTGCFKRVHCVTFGTPPITLLPLQNPSGRRYGRNVFMTFANEGDPVVRADRQYLSTLTKIIAAPSPVLTSSGPQKTLRQRVSRQALKGVGNLAGSKISPVRWEVPPATLSNAGRLVLLRQKPNRRHIIEAVQVTDEDLRDRIFGDPEMHGMALYKKRVDELAIAAVTGRGVG